VTSEVLSCDVERYPTRHGIEQSRAGHGKSIDRHLDTYDSSHSMDNMNMQNAPPPPPLGGGGQMPPPIPQLPPQMFTTAAQLLDLTDSEHILPCRMTRVGLWEQD
jgi:hypothetical protein